MHTSWNQEGPVNQAFTCHAGQAPHHTNNAGSVTHPLGGDQASLQACCLGRVHTLLCQILLLRWIVSCIRQPTYHHIDRHVLGRRQYGWRLGPLAWVITLLHLCSVNLGMSVVLKAVMQILLAAGSWYPYVALRFCVNLDYTIIRMPRFSCMLI